MTDQSRSLIFEWRAQAGFADEVSFWRDFLIDHPAAEFPLHWATLDWWFDDAGRSSGPNLLARKVTTILGADLTSKHARLALHDLVYWFAAHDRSLTDSVLVALGVALEVIDPLSGRPDLAALWNVAYPKDLRQVAERDAASGCQLTAARLAADHPHPEAFAKLIRGMRRKPAYKLIAAAASSPKREESPSV